METETIVRRDIEEEEVVFSFYETLKSYLIAHNIQIKDFELLKIIALMSVYHNIYMYHKFESIEAKDLKTLRLSNTQLKNYKILNLMMYENIFNNLERYYNMTGMIVLNNDDKFAILKLSDDEKKQDYLNNPNLIYDIYGMVNRFFETFNYLIINPKSFFVIFNFIFSHDQAVKHGQKYYDDYEKFIGLFNIVKL